MQLPLKDSEINSLTEQVESLRQEVTDCNRVIESLRDKNRELKTELENSCNDVDRLASENERLQFQLSNQTSKNSDDSRLLAEAQNELAQLKPQYEKTLATYVLTTAENERLAGNLKESMDNVAKLQDEVQNLKS